MAYSAYNSLCLSKFIMTEQDYVNNMQELLLEIPKEKVTTYAEIAHAMNLKAYRLIGRLLNKIPYPEEYPCHKVVNANGKVGGFGSGSI